MISVVDSLRYSDKTFPISECFSDEKYYVNRVLVELAYLEIVVAKANNTYVLEDTGDSEKEKIVDDETLKSVQDEIKEIRSQLDIPELCSKIHRDIMEIEIVTQHDVKAIEYYLATTIKTKGVSQFIHCGATSQDINSVAFTLMLKMAGNVLYKKLEGFGNMIYNNLVVGFADEPIMTYTHGQAAVASYFGLEVNKLLLKINCSVTEFLEATYNLTSKFSGSIGNYTTHRIIFPMADVY